MKVLRGKLGSLIMVTVILCSSFPVFALFVQPGEFSTFEVEDNRQFLMWSLISLNVTEEKVEESDSAKKQNRTYFTRLNANQTILANGKVGSLNNRLNAHINYAKSCALFLLYSCLKMDTL